MNAKLPGVETVFAGALEILSPSERAAYLARACAGNNVLRRDVETLLDAHERAGQFLELRQLAATADRDQIPAPEGPGATIGPYRLLEPIGEGGMGTVFLAEQAQPVRRKVALKVIKPGMDTNQVIARFEAERQALALMDHPSIARVLDAGATEGGRPYFVMELVPGIPITDYCDREQLAITQRLDLFVLVCRAVQHAHQKGVIHRDLKPSNILVTLIDGAAVPKVIDFGVAKATGASLTDRTLFTACGQLIGTPQYMSPEQTEPSGVDIDTRSDVYALGVLLYELLTGTTPLERETLRTATFDEVRRIIREEEPARPSTRLSALGAKLTTVSANRNADPRRLGRAVRGELDWIVMKALEKDRRRRYETASHFAADLLRYLGGKPVEACPPSAWYRFSKYVRLHRAALTTAALVGLALVAGTAMSTWQAIRATRAGVVAGQREREARSAAAESRAVLEFLVRDMLAASEPGKALGRDVKVGEVLANAEKKIGTAFPDQPQMEAGVRHALASAFCALGQYDVAVRHASRARDLRLRHLGPEHPDTLSSMHNLALGLSEQGKKDEARRLLERTVEIQRRVLGPEHPDTLHSMNSQAAALWAEGKTDEARTLYEHTLEIQRRVLAPEHPDTLISMHNLALGLWKQGKGDEARKLLERTLEIQRRVLGPEHPGTLDSANDLAQLLKQQGQMDEARKLHEQTLENRRRVLGPEHRDTLASMNTVAHALEGQGKTDEARKLQEQTLEISRRVLGPGHPDTLRSMSNLAFALIGQGKREQARELFEQTLELQRRLPGPEHPAVFDSLYGLVLLMLNAPDPPTDDRIRALELTRQMAAERPDEQLSWKWLGVAEYCNGHWDAAIDAEERCLKLRGDRGWAFQWLVLALAHSRRGDRAEAEHWCGPIQASYLINPTPSWADTPRWLIAEAEPLLGEVPPRTDRVRVREWIRRGLENDPKLAEWWRLRALSDYQAGQWADALQAVETWRGLAKDAGKKANAGLEEILRAAVHARKGERDTARTWYDRAIRAREELRKAGTKLNVDLDYLEFRLDTEKLLGLEPQPGEPSTLPADPATRAPG
jgi:serine/threonine protein kinase/tetratricopeptide (TPR) repeat protein